MKQPISLADHFTYRHLLRFTFPSIGMMVFSSIYGVVDGFFVSNFAGKTPFAAVNFIMPFLMILNTVGFMFGTGGSALISRAMGEGEDEHANRIFSLLVYVSLAVGSAVGLLGILFLPVVAAALGAEGQLLSDCVLYGRIILLSLPLVIAQMEFQTFFVTAEKPQLGFYATLAAGLTNMVLDALLVGVFPFGLAGAAIATTLSQAVGALIPLFYSSRPNNSRLRLGKTAFCGEVLFRTCTNGSSELMSNLSMSLVGMLYNTQLYRFAGEDGVAAYGVMMYVNFVFISIFIGYSIGTAPVIGYHFGAKNQNELRGLLRKSVILIASCGAVMLALGILLAEPLSVLFVGYDAALSQMTLRGFRIFSLSFPFAGFAIFFSGFFTALSDGVTSAVISFLRTVVFQVAAVLLLPLLFGIDGIWYSVVAAEVMAVAVGLVFLIKKKKRFGY